MIGRQEKMCTRCHRSYSARGWLIVASECKDMCGRCEDEIRAVASVVGLMGMAHAIRDVGAAT